MPYDLLIKGGEVVDPSQGLRRRLDVAIAGGTIAALDADIPLSAAERVADASGCLVTPGLIDLHIHSYWGATFWGIEMDPVCARTGVTATVDAGSAGYHNFPGFRRWIADPMQTRHWCYLNIACIGMTNEYQELMVLDYADVDLAVKAADANRGLVLGIKVRVGPNIQGDLGLRPMQRARQAADRLGLPIMVHFGEPPPTLEEVVQVMKSGDVLTHCFNGRSNSVVGANGRVREVAKRARDKGIVFDVGHGYGSFKFDVGEAALAEGFLPDVISTDLHSRSITGPVYDLPTTMSKFLNMGMSLEEVIRRTAEAPARVIGQAGKLGTLRVGAEADVAVFELLGGDYEFYDCHEQVRRWPKRLVNTLTVLKGKVMERA
jgi:dihydroorotase